MRLSARHLGQRVDDLFGSPSLKDSSSAADGVRMHPAIPAVNTFFVVSTPKRPSLGLR
jgi:hypothetical protein